MRRRNSRRFSCTPTALWYGSVGVWEYGEGEIADAHTDAPSVQRKAHIADWPEPIVQVRIQNPPTPPHSHTPTQIAKPRAKQKRYGLQPTFLACLLACLLALGCAESVETRVEIDRPFSVFGLINPKADTNAIRVFEIESEIRLVRPDPIDAVVTTTLMQTGDTQAWQDSVIQLADGDYRHVFWAEFSASAGETYRLEVTRSDGETTWAETTVPPPVTLEVLEPDTLIAREALQPIFIRGGPPTLPRIDVEYIVVGFRAGGSVPIFKPVTFNYAGKPTQQSGGWLLEIDLIEDFKVIFQVFDTDAEVTTEIIDLREIRVRVHVGDENWVSPIGVFDAEFLVEPGTFSNIENGFGFFGSAYIESTTFRPPLTLIRRAGFYVIGEG